MARPHLWRWPWRSPWRSRLEVRVAVWTSAAPCCLAGEDLSGTIRGPFAGRLNRTGSFPDGAINLFRARKFRPRSVPRPCTARPPAPAHFRGCRACESLRWAAPAARPAGRPDGEPKINWTGFGATGPDRSVPLAARCAAVRRTWGNVEAQRAQRAATPCRPRPRFT